MSEMLSIAKKEIVVKASVRFKDEDVPNATYVFEYNSTTDDFSLKKILVYDIPFDATLLVSNDFSFSLKNIPFHTSYDFEGYVPLNYVEIDILERNEGKKPYIEASNEILSLLEKYKRTVVSSNKKTYNLEELVF